ncbi:MAG: hypothetical protein V1744_06675 [Candidatus Altiarchaeota archaeon]
MTSILEETNGELKFSGNIQEFILDEKMELKAVKLRGGETVDYEHLHRHFSPKHPLLKTPSILKRTLDQFFLHEFKEKRLAPF